MRTSMVYPNIITSLPPAQPTRDLPDLSRLRIRDDEDHSRSRKRSHSRRRSPSRRRHRDDGHRSARTTPLHSPRKDVRFFDESPSPRHRRPVIPERPKSYFRDAPPIAINESAKETSRRLWHERHHRGESSASNSYYGGSRSASRATSRANSPVASRRPENGDRPRPARPGMHRGYTADVIRRADQGVSSNLATTGGTDTLSPLAVEAMRPGHRRWHSKG